MRPGYKSSRMAESQYAVNTSSQSSLASSTKDEASASDTGDEGSAITQKKWYKWNVSRPLTKSISRRPVLRKNPLGSEERPSDSMPEVGIVLTKLKETLRGRHPQASGSETERRLASLTTPKAQTCHNLNGDIHRSRRSVRFAAATHNGAIYAKIAPTDPAEMSNEDASGKASLFAEAVFKPISHPTRTGPSNKPRMTERPKTPNANTTVEVPVDSSLISSIEPRIIRSPEALLMGKAVESVIDPFPVPSSKFSTTKLPELPSFSYRMTMGSGQSRVARVSEAKDTTQLSSLAFGDGVTVNDWRLHRTNGQQVQKNSNQEIGKSGALAKEVGGKEPDSQGNDKVDFTASDSNGLTTEHHTINTQETRDRETNSREPNEKGVPDHYSRYYEYLTQSRKPISKIGRSVQSLKCDRDSKFSGKISCESSERKAESPNSETKTREQIAEQYNSMNPNQ